MKRKVNRFIVGYTVLLAVLASAGYFAGDYTARMRVAHTTLGANQRFATDVDFVDLPRMNMTMASGSSGQTGHVRIDISLEVEKKNLVRFEDYQPIITDRMIQYVRKLNMDDMLKTNAVPNLRKELLKEANTVSYPMPVVDVIFRQFIVM